MLPNRSAFSTDSDPFQQIKQLQQFRWGLIGTSYLAALAAWWLQYPVSSWPLMLLLLALYACTNLSLPWLPGSHQQPQRVFAVAILYDLTLFTLMLALAGGAGNGLIALLLLPVAVSAVLLPGRIALLTAALAVSCYLTLALLLPLNPVDPQTGQLIYDPHAAHRSHQVFIDGATPDQQLPEQFSSHLWQMAWAFTLSAFFIAAFVSAQARLVRQKSRELMQLQRQQSQQEQMLTVATYAANAAHELATPLQNLTLLTDELNDGPPDPTLLKDLQQEVRRCQQIVQQLRQNAQQLRLPQQQAPLHQVVQQALKLWLVSRPEISLTLDEQLDGSQCLVADTLAWSAALFNILDNAADAGIAAQQPRLAVRLSQQRQLFVLQIEDFGCGLPAAQLGELGKLPQPSPDGLGLGQFLATSSIERLGGVVTRGASATGGLITPNPLSSRKPLMKLTILDDDEILLRTLQRRLSAAGCQVRTYATPPQLAELIADPADVWLLDLRFGDVSRAELRCAAAEALPDSRILVLTGFASIATAVQAVKLGADDYLTKPVDFAVLLQALQGDIAVPLANETSSDDSEALLSTDQMEWEHIQRVLAQQDGNISQTARLLGMHRRTLQRKLLKHRPG